MWSSTCLISVVDEIMASSTNHGIQWLAPSDCRHCGACHCRVWRVGKPFCGRPGCCQKPLDPPCHPFNKPLGRWLFKGEPTWSFWLVTRFWMQHFLVLRLARVSITLAHNPMIYTVYNPYIWVWIKVINICQPKIDGFTQTLTNFCGSSSPLPQWTWHVSVAQTPISGVVWHRWISQFVALLTGKTRL